MKKKQFTTYLTPELHERVRDAVYWSPGETLSDFTARAIENEIARQEKKRGKKFEPRKGSGTLASGRPIR